MAKIVIVIPTYNERPNIGLVLEKIFQLDIAGLNVLVVDDNSPDGTAAVVADLQAGNTRLHLLRRQQKAGLGPAYVAGFRWALDNQADYVFEMDADLSHDPKYIPQFLAAILDHDVVLGSRYIHGGGVANWNFFRRFISRFGNLYAQLVLGLPFHDLTGGYKCFRRQALTQIGLDRVSSVGYNFQVETTFWAYRHGFRITEIPIMFTERYAGRSKFSGKIFFESFWKVLQLRFRKL